MFIVEEHLPIVEVLDLNISDVWPQLQKTLMESSFIAIDTEMSGLGDRKKLFYPEVDMRYKYIAELAHSHGTLSMGISGYNCTRSDATGQHYTVRTYDILVLPETSFSVQTDSLKFLQSHGFNFNKLVQHGLPYTPGNDLPEAEASLDESGDSSTSSDGSVSTDSLPEKITARRIFQCLVAARKPIILHNGFVDLVFLYQHFYAELPKKLETFASNIDEMFPLGIYDTKYFSEFVNRAPATYLQFVYVKELLHNERCRQEDQLQLRCVAPHVRVSFPSQGALQSGLMYYRHLRGLHQDTHPDDSRSICESFSYHGWCKVGDTCLDSHNVQRIVKELCGPGRKSMGGGSSSKGGRSNYRSGPRSTGTSAMLQSALRHNALYTNIEKQASKRAKVESEEKRQANKNREDTHLCNGDGAKCVDERLSAVGSEHRLEVRRGASVGSSGCGAVNASATNECLEQITVQVSNSTDKKEKNGNVIHGEFVSFCGNSVGNGSDSLDNGNAVIESTDGAEVRDDKSDLPQSVPSSNDFLSNTTKDSSICDEPSTNILEELSNSCSVNGTAKRLDTKQSSSLGAATDSSNGQIEDGTVKCLKRGFPLTREGCQRTSSNTSTSEGHSSGFDAFMTGFIFASYICQNGKAESNLEHGDFLPSAIGLKDHVNKVYLMGKNFPFLVKTTRFAKPSNNHTKKINKIRKLYSPAVFEAPPQNGATPSAATAGLC